MIDKSRIGVFHAGGSTDDLDVRKGHEYQRVMKYYRKKPLLVISGLFSLIFGAMPVMLGYYLRGFVSSYPTSSNKLSTLISYVQSFSFGFIAMLVSMTISDLCTFVTTPEFARDLRNMIFEKLITQNIEMFDRVPVGIMISRLSEDVEFALEVYLGKFNMSLMYIAQIASGLILAFITCWRVAIAVFPVVPLALIIYYICERIVGKQWHEYNRCSTLTVGKSEEVIASFRTVKSCDRELFEADQYMKNLRDIHRVVVKASQVHATKNALITFLSWAVMAPATYYGAWMLKEQPWNGFQTGDMVILLNAYSTIGIAVSMVVDLVNDIRQASTSSSKLLRILDAPTAARSYGSDLQNVAGKIEFRHVSFKYPGQTTYALNDVSFIIHAGETVALVGESGCGKSTTLQLLERFYPIEEGQILIDDVDISTVSEVSVRENLAIVLQSPVMFSVSIADNIRYGLPDADESTVTEAAIMGHGHEFIMENGGYDVQSGPTKLSGGQKQRISISRAILSNKPVMLLDEATAFLDTESEDIVQRSLAEARRGRTTVIVAHRLATVRNANRILVFQSGRIVESGTYEELLGQQGRYADLVKFQIQ